MCYYSGPSAPPENVTAVPLSPTTIMVTWDVVSESERNGNITSYDVTFSQVIFTEIPSNLSTATGGPQRGIVLHNLEEDVEYSIAVRARTIVGAGPYSPPAGAQTLQAGTIILFAIIPIIHLTNTFPLYNYTPLCMLYICCSFHWLL